jgi:hypothetical protein
LENFFIVSKTALFTQGNISIKKILLSVVSVISVVKISFIISTTEITEITEREET